MSRFMAWYGVAAWGTVLALLALLSAIPPGIALYRRSSELRLVATIVGVPAALTVYYALTLPVWLVCWSVGLGIAIRSPGLESRRETKRREAANRQRLIEETRRPLVSPDQIGLAHPAGGVPRSAWGRGATAPVAATDDDPPLPSPPLPST